MEEIMKKRLFASLALTLLVVALGFYFKSTASSVALAQDEPDPSATQTVAGLRDHDDRPLTIVFDVASDARTFRLNKSGTLLDARRGDGFIVEGKIYPGGTIPPGGTMENPGPFDPDTAPGSIGKWVCRGTFYVDIGEILAGAEPHVFTTQHHLFNDGKSLVHDGPEGGRQLRAIIGGVGGFSRAAGEVIEEPIGVNKTGLFNSRFTFKIKRRSLR
jgi:hypothetical protein